MSNAHRVVVYTQEYPTPNDPTDGLFTQQLVDSLSERIGVTVVCPVPWFPMPDALRRRTGWVSTRGIPLRSRRGNVDIHFPRIPLVPVITRAIQPQVQSLRLWNMLRGLRTHGKLQILNAHSVYPDGVAAALLARRLKLPLVLTAIGSDINENLGSEPRLRQIRWALESAAAVVGVSKALCATMQRVAPEAKIEHIPNGIDRQVFARLGANVASGVNELEGDERPIVLFVGRLHPVKGLDVLQAAIGKLKQSGQLNFQTVIVGDGPERDALLNQRAALNLVRDVRFIGARPHAEVAAWLRRCKIFCLPSRNEGMPNVVLEAQASGVPVVATRVGGLTELVSERSGILVAPENAPLLADALGRAMNTDWVASDIEQEVSWADWGRSADRYVQIFDRIASGVA